MLTAQLLQVANPEFEGQTKTRLGNPEVGMSGGMNVVLGQSRSELVSRF